MCNCWIGILHNYDQCDTNNLELDTYVDKLKDISRVSFAMAKTSGRFKAFSPKSYIDKRRGLATLFNFCPWCGAEINWRELRKAL